MENKVIIGLDEYLDLRDRAQKVDKLKCIGKIVDEDQKLYADDPFIGYKVRVRREIIISNKNLTEYINDILGVRGYEVRIEFEKGENNGSI